MGHEKLKQRVENALEECEAILKDFDAFIKSSDNGEFAKLKEIEKTIENFQGQGLAVPDELRHLKLNLISLCDGVEALKVLKERFLNGISKIFSNAILSKQPQIIPVRKKRHIESSPRFFPPDKISCRFRYNGVEYLGQIQNGSFYVNGHGVFTSFSAASVKISRTSRNGWRDWELRLPGSNQWLLADAWRETQKYSKNENG